MAVEYAIKSGFKEVTIGYNYQGVESWALGTWKRNNRITSEYNEFMQSKMKEIKIKFKKIKGHSLSVSYNNYISINDYLYLINHIKAGIYNSLYIPAFII